MRTRPIFPALHCIEQQGRIQAKWEESEINRRAISDGVKYLRQEQAQWKRLALAIDLVPETP